MSDDYQVRRRKLADYIQNPDNPVAHNQRNMKVLVDSIYAVGAGRSGLAKEGKLLAGNLTWESMAEAGIEDVIEVTTDGKAWVIVNRPDLTDEQARQAAYYDQRSGELADWDAEQLLADIEAGMDLSELWYDNELDELLDGLREEPAVDPGAQVDRAAELQEKWQVETGDIWQCGDDLWLICGDCRQPEIWMRLLEAAGVNKVNGVFTSPPYAEQRKQQYGGVPVDEYVDWWEAVQANVRAHLADDGSFFVNIKPHCEDGERVLYVMDLVLAMKRRWGWRFVDEFCWRYSTNGMPGKYYPRLKNAFEPIYWFAQGVPMLRTIDIKEPYREASIKRMRKLSKRERRGRVYSSSDSGFNYDRRQFDPSNGALPSNVIEFAPEVNPANPHAAPFPVALPDFFIRAYSDLGNVWCDPFAGSGTTGVAAHQNGRRFVGIELLEKYCAVGLQRFADIGFNPQRIDQFLASG